MLQRTNLKRITSRTCKELKRDNCMIIRYDDNVAVMIDQEGNPKGTQVFGAIVRELRQFNFTKIVSLSPEIKLGVDSEEIRTHDSYQTINKTKSTHNRRFTNSLKSRSIEEAAAANLLLELHQEDIVTEN
ncbi:hypothetical protein R6Q59_014516 [Mikania micrantha]